MLPYPTTREHVLLTCFRWRQGEGGNDSGGWVYKVNGAGRRAMLFKVEEAEAAGFLGGAKFGT